MPQKQQLSEKTQILLILSTSIALGFVTGWWLLQQNFLKFPKLDRPSKFATNFTTVSKVPKGIFYYGGSTVWGKLRENLEPVIETAHPLFQLEQ